MQYYKKELWLNENLSLEEQAQAELIWNKNSKAYYERFLTLSNIISPKAYGILKDKSFHDYSLKSVEIIKAKSNNRDIELHLLITNKKELWKIKYKKIKSINVNFDSFTNYLMWFGFDTWGYDEILDVDEYTLSHEILFASGGTIKVCFKNKNIFIDKINVNNQL